jgi:integrase
MARGARDDRAEWERRGGRARTDSKGRTVYVIRKQVNGRRYEVSTRKHTLSAAFIELERFEKNPDAYVPGGGPAGAPIYLSTDLARDFLAWSLNEKRNTAKWVGQQRLYLAWWASALAGVNLRGASLRDRILPKLAGQPAKAQKIATLKVLYSWLRTVRHDIITAEDPTFGQLSVPQARPEQLRRVKALPRDHLTLAVEHLASDRWRDLLRVLAGTGMHVAELERFATDGAVEPLPRDGRAEGAEGAIVIPSTKAGDPLRVAVGAEVLAAAKRVLEAGAFDRAHFDKAVTSACAAAGIPRFGAGQLRHSVATWAVNAGADPATVSSFLGHKSPRTTKKFYATHATPRKVPTLL